MREVSGLVGRIGALRFRRGGGATSRTNVTLGLGGVVASILLCHFGGTAGVLSGEVLDLAALLDHCAVGVTKVLVDELLVLDVNERTEVDGTGSDKRQAPERNELDQVVGHG